MKSTTAAARTLTVQIFYNISEKRIHMCVTRKQMNSGKVNYTYVNKINRVIFALNFNSRAGF